MIHDGEPSIAASAPAVLLQSLAPDRDDGQEGWTLICQGAEARIWKVVASDASTHPSSEAASHAKVGIAYATVGITSIMICKERFRKTYRHPVIDERLTKQRCRMEARLLEKCLVKGLKVPKVLRVEGARIYLEYLDGPTVRDFLRDHLLSQLSFSSGHDTTSGDEPATAATTTVQQLAHEMGSTIARLHTAGMVHGDLTTSNMMLIAANNADDRKEDVPQNLAITLIDFGLAKNTTSAEERAVDLYVLERALQSTHPTLPESFWETVLVAYAAAAADGGPKSSTTKQYSSETTLTRLEQVRQRGRKRECFG